MITTIRFRTTNPDVLVRRLVAARAEIAVGLTAAMRDVHAGAEVRRLGEAVDRAMRAFVTALAASAVADAMRRFAFTGRPLPPRRRRSKRRTTRSRR